MPNAAIKSTVYCLNHTPELGLHYGHDPCLERRDKPDSPFLANLAGLIQPYGDAARYAPNQAYIGAMTIGQLEAHPRPWHANLASEPTRFGKYGKSCPRMNSSVFWTSVMSSTWSGSKQVRGVCSQQALRPSGA